MRPRIIRWLPALALAVVLSSAAPTQAKLIGKIAGVMALSGFNFDFRPNLLMGGGNVGANASYNEQTFNFGIATLTLDGFVRKTAGYTDRFLPTVDNGFSTRGVPLDYTLRIGTGFLGLVFDGSIEADLQTDGNLLGFYDQRVQVSNRGTWSLERIFLPDRDGSTDFDVGPYTARGQVFLDTVGLFLTMWFPEPFNPFLSISRNATDVAGSLETIDAGSDATLQRPLEDPEEAAARLMTEAQQAEAPEPATAVAALFGLGVLVFGRRRR